MRLWDSVSILSLVRDVFAGSLEESTPLPLEGHIDAIGDITPRTHVRIYGVVSAIVVPPADAPERFDVEIDDGTGRCGVRWMGREHITGIDPGVRIEVEGFATGTAGRIVLFNPKYTIHGAKESEL